ncbi:MAG TPA: fumarylacetoacetate hydrolase family protein [Caulobacteraceae bacterium]
MKLASFHADEAARVGLAIDGVGVVELSAQVVGADPALWPDSVDALIAAGPQAWDLAREAARRITADPAGASVYALDAVSWRPPVARPSKICCVAFNNSANSDRIMRGPKHPALFLKPASALVGHLGAIECRAEYGRVHPEPELAVVIGKAARNIRAEDAYDHVFGYTIHNDITSPTMREEDTFHYRAIHPKSGAKSGAKSGDTLEIEYVDSWVSYPGRYKGADTFACLGPWIVTKDEIADPHALTVTCRHNGALVTEDNTENFFFKLPELLQFISRYMTLEPGDIVSMGTALKPSARGGAVQNIDLNRLGGRISVTIDQIGELTNTVAHLHD